MATSPVNMNWFRLASGEDCSFDPPRAELSDDWDVVARLGVSTLCLLSNQAYRGHCILIYDPRHAARPDELSKLEWRRYSEDLHTAVRALVEVCRPDHINVESLGNQMPHLHWHVIPRYRTDPRWGGAVWTTTVEEMHHHELPEAERVCLILELRECLERFDSVDP